jgi:acetoin utilization deacetylase AcuC-like enzyme
VNVCLTPIGPGPWDPRARSKLNLKQRTALRDTASKELRRKVEGMLLPRLKQFSPELLLISAGFDAHQDDLYHFLGITSL